MYYDDAVPIGNADGLGMASQIFIPDGVAVDLDGNVYVADTDNSEIRKITRKRYGLREATLGGTPIYLNYDVHNGLPFPEFEYADGTGAGALFYAPESVAVDLDGNVYVADTLNNVIRKGVAPLVQLVALEVTQAIQDWSNSVPLIAGKETYVRALLQLTSKATASVMVSDARALWL